MNIRYIINRLGILLWILAVGMLPSLVMSIVYNESDVDAFVKSIAVIVTLALGTLAFKPRTAQFYARDGHALAGFGWIVVTLCGAMPYFFSDSFATFADAIFESASGFTTTGASVLLDIDNMPRGIIFWRSFTHWMGGLGFLILMLAILPSTRANGLFILKAESSGPSMDKFVPKIRQLASILYIIYIIITLLLISMLLLGGMSAFDAVVHAFGAVSTGGFSSYSLNIGAFNRPYFDWVFIIFMLASGVNYGLYYALFQKNFKSVFKDQELRLYGGIALTAASVIALDTFLRGVYPSIGETIRKALFAVSSILTTTGYSNADFNLWPTLSKSVLLLLMLFGACAVSTSGGFKLIRVLILYKAGRREIDRLIHPRSVRAVTINGRIVDDDVLSGTLVYFALYISLLILLTLVVSLDGESLVTTFSAALASLSNIGIGLDAVGVSGTFANLSSLSKISLSLGMIVGRLEIYPVLIFCARATWKRAAL
ncbi:MAG: TrkH family potassium uptake protein [Oscillospiraceae bacterium]|jgi:trk system potassium uptake protein TrkH|nr:TrkH family potassium uptake protein [Oscillospiraceae bacterium]